MKKEKIVSDLVNWCLERTEELSEDDELALLQEFDEWILYESEEIDNIDVIALEVNS